MGITVTNDTGETDIYLGFSNDPAFDLSSTIKYFTTKIPLGGDDQAIKMNTNDAYYDSKDYKYMVIAKKSLTGGALVFKVDDLASQYGTTESPLNLRVTTTIGTSGVYMAYHDVPEGQMGYNVNFPAGMVPLGTSFSGPTMFVKLPSFAITSNVAKSVDPADYVVGDMSTGPAFAYGNATTPLAVVQNVPYVTKAAPGGLPNWVVIMILIVLVVVIVSMIGGGFMYVMKKKKERGY